MCTNQMETVLAVAIWFFVLECSMKKIRTSLSPLWRDGTKMPTRTVYFDVVANESLPRCSWCRVQHLVPLSETTHYGFTMNLIQTACWCEFCEKGTIVEYEISTQDGE